MVCVPLAHLRRVRPPVSEIAKAPRTFDLAGYLIPDSPLSSHKKRDRSNVEPVGDTSFNLTSICQVASEKVAQCNPPTLSLQMARPHYASIVKVDAETIIPQKVSFTRRCTSVGLQSSTLFSEVLIKLDVLPHHRPEPFRDTALISSPKMEKDCRGILDRASGHPPAH